MGAQVAIFTPVAAESAVYTGQTPAERINWLLQTSCFFVKLSAPCHLFSLSAHYQSFSRPTIQTQRLIKDYSFVLKSFKPVSLKDLVFTMSTQADEWMTFFFTNTKRDNKWPWTWCQSSRDCTISSSQVASYRWVPFGYVLYCTFHWLWSCSLLPQPQWTIFNNIMSVITERWWEKLSFGNQRSKKMR